MNILKLILIIIISFYASFSFSEELQLNESVYIDLTSNEIEQIQISKECEYQEYCQCPPDVAFDCNENADCYENQFESDSCGNCDPVCQEKIDCCCCVKEDLTGLAAVGSSGYGGGGGGYGGGIGFGGGYGSGGGGGDGGGGGGGDDNGGPPTVIPEPKTWTLLGILFAMVAICVKKKKQKV